MATALLAFYWILCATATHIPMPPGTDPFQLADKVVHFLMYGLLALIFGLRFRPSFVAALILASYAVADELTQPFFGRSAEWLDWLADCAGIAVGLWISRNSSVRSGLRIFGGPGRT